MPYFYFDDDDQIHYVKSLHELPEYLFGDTQPFEPVSEDGGEWTLDRALAAFDEDDEMEEQS